jgi:hypothetical protein
VLGNGAAAMILQLFLFEWAGGSIITTSRVSIFIPPLLQLLLRTVTLRGGGIPKNVKKSAERKATSLRHKYTGLVELSDQ